MLYPLNLVDLYLTKLLEEYIYRYMKVLQSLLNI